MSELEIWNELGNIYFQNEAYDEAIRAYQKAIELDHGCSQSYSNLATIFIRQGRYPDAIPMLQKGIELQEGAAPQAVLWDQMAEVYRMMEDYDDAVACYRRAADLDPEEPAYQDNLAEAELDRKHRNSQGRPVSYAHKESPATIQETSGQDEHSRVSWVFKNQGLVYDPDEAAPADPDTQPVVLGNRLLTEAPGKPVAPEQAGRSAGKAPTNPRADGLLRLGLKHWRQKDYERAIRFLEGALNTVVRPKDNLLEALCYNAIALVETDLGKIVEAIQAYQSAASLAPDTIFPWNSLGNLNCMLDRYDDALAAFKEAIEHDPRDPVSWNGMGDVYHKLNRFEDAIAAYQLGNVFEHQKQAEDPLNTYERTIEASRRNPEVWNEAGNIYFNTGAYEEAVGAYRKASELDPADYTFQDNLAKARKALEDSGQAAASLEESAVPASEAEQASLEPVLLEQKEPPPQENAPALAGETPASGPEAGYWVNKRELTPGNVLQPAHDYSPVGAEASAGAVKALPTYGSVRQERTFTSPLGSHPDNKKNTSALLVQLTPRPTTPTRPGSGSLALPAALPTQAAPASPVPPAGLPAQAGSDTPARQADKPAEPPKGDLSVLEKDIAAYRKVTEINRYNDRAWDVLGNMYENAGMHSEAIASFEQAI
ncbi:MAG TPA: tetratricopeptide repeat protein, partial [Anaerolineales bacterium]|nr:tetratricopeptide repeat protein [Anaerolineales bacterium]